jgi:hypothetical protein
MFGTVAASLKLKAIIAVCALLLSGIGLHEMSVSTVSISQPVKSYDPFTQDIQARSDLVLNAVMEADNKKSEYGTIAYKQTCESSLSYIQTERLNTETDYNTLDAGQKELIQNYRNYLKESANVVSLYRSGDTPDLSAMTKAKEKLY